MVKTNRTDPYMGSLDGDAEIERWIEEATSGPESLRLEAAWSLIHMLKTALLERRVSPPLFDHAARFFETPVRRTQSEPVRDQPVREPPERRTRERHAGK